ncbi:DUF2950 domain-containing protein [Reyranella sp.]|uniref:DUF2950 domain-containing protein n=1 Tax=Reyranella sp. TaxID=1929291 RepID=UPI0025F0AFEA|nr:DUF2950 domain-containing protein [Reyranella sp.]
MTGLVSRSLAALALYTGLLGASVAQTPAPMPAQAQTQKQAPQLKGFPTPEAAADALTEAIRKQDDKAITAILGVDWHTLIPGSDWQDDELRDQFLKAWDEKHTIIQETPDKALVGAGKTGWVSPIPIVRQANEWRYDVEAGRVELEARLIGRDEFAVIQTLLAIVDAQRDYASLDPMKLGVPVYARRLVSSPGLKNGLYWETKPGEPPSPLGPLLAKAQLGDVERNGYYGYRFRLLYSQGPDAPGGARDYLVRDRMMGGFAVVAWPVHYGETGIMTFMISNNSDVYEKDLGEQTAQRATAINVFNPDSSWDKADMTPP